MSHPFIHFSSLPLLDSRDQKPLELALSSTSIPHLSFPTFYAFLLPLRSLECDLNPLNIPDKLPWSCPFVNGPWPLACPSLSRSRFRHTTRARHLRQPIHPHIPTTPVLLSDHQLELWPSVGLEKTTSVHRQLAISSTWYCSATAGLPSPRAFQQTASPTNPLPSICLNQDFNYFIISCLVFVHRLHSFIHLRQVGSSIINPSTTVSSPSTAEHYRSANRDLSSTPTSP